MDISQTSNLHKNKLAKGSKANKLKFKYTHDIRKNNKINDYADM